MAKIEAPPQEDILYIIIDSRGKVLLDTAHERHYEAIRLFQQFHGKNRDYWEFFESQGYRIGIFNIAMKEIQQPAPKRQRSSSMFEMPDH